MYCSCDCLLSVLQLSRDGGGVHVRFVDLDAAAARGETLVLPVEFKEDYERLIHDKVRELTIQESAAAFSVYEHTDPDSDAASHSISSPVQPHHQQAEADSGLGLGLEASPLPDRTAEQRVAASIAEVRHEAKRRYQLQEVHQEQRSEEKEDADVDKEPEMEIVAEAAEEETEGNGKDEKQEQPQPLRLSVDCAICQDTHDHQTDLVSAHPCGHRFCFEGLSGASKFSSKCCQCRREITRYTFLNGARQGQAAAMEREVPNRGLEDSVAAEEDEEEQMLEEQRQEYLRMRRRAAVQHRRELEAALRASAAEAKAQADRAREDQNREREQRRLRRASLLDPAPPSPVAGEAAELNVDQVCTTAISLGV